MTEHSPHVLFAGGRRIDRVEAITDEPLDQMASCHERRSGPFTGLRTALRGIVPEANQAWPELVATHRVVLTYLVPELSDVVGAAPRTLVDSTPHEERTRYFGNDWIRAMFQGVATFLIAYARRSAEMRGRPLTLGFDDIDAADGTEQEFLAILLRRADPGVLRLVLGSTGAAPIPELERALKAYAVEREGATPARHPGPARSPEQLRAAFIASDGTTDNPDEVAAYEAAPREVTAALHDERALELEQGTDHAATLGAIPYHRERGSDPAGAGRQALRAALEYCVAKGFSAATVNFGLRGRAVCDPYEHQQDYCHFSAKAASAMVPLGRLSECEAIYRELLRLYSRPRVHMTSCYALAMLHTRFYQPRDHEHALELINTSRAFASMETDPVEAAYLQVYQDNGLALIEMHRGNLERSLTLVTEGMARLDREIPGDRYLVHRSQLLHNRARVLVALQRFEDARADFDRLIDWDPDYVEYRMDRGNLSRRVGNIPAALDDYDRAIKVSAPFPELFYNRADLRAEAGDIEGALADLTYVVEMEPTLVDAWLNRGALLLEAGNPEAAGDDARAGLAQAPANPRLHCLLGLTEQSNGSRETARAAFDDALAADPTHAPALVQRAVLEFETGDCDASIADLERALALTGDDPDTLYNRGIAYTAAGRFAEAVDDFTRALSLGGADIAELLVARADAESRCAASLCENSDNGRYSHKEHPTRL